MRELAPMRKVRGAIRGTEPKHIDAKVLLRLSSRGMSALCNSGTAWSFPARVESGIAAAIDKVRDGRNREIFPSPELRCTGCSTGEEILFAVPGSAIVSVAGCCGCSAVPAADIRSDRVASVPKAPPRLRGTLPSPRWTSMSSRYSSRRRRIVLT